MTVIALVVIVPAALYVVLSTNFAMAELKRVGEEEMSQLLGTEVTIGDVEMRPFNMLLIKDIDIQDDYGTTALTAADIEARFEFWHFITTGHLVFDYARIDGISVNLYKKTSDAPLNIAGIIERLKSEEKDKKPPRFDLSLYTLRIESGRLEYNVLDSPEHHGKFDINHISLSDLNLYATAPTISDKEIDVKLRHLSFTESSGFNLKNITADVEYTPTGLICHEMKIETGRSCLLPGDLTFDYSSPDELSQLFVSLPVQLSLLKGSYVNTADLAYFVPQLSGVDRNFNIELDVTASRNRIALTSLSLDEAAGDISVNMSGTVDAPFDKNEMALHDVSLKIETNTSNTLALLSRTDIKLPEGAMRYADLAGFTRLTAHADGTPRALALSADVSTSVGSINITADLKSDDSFKDVRLTADINGADIALGDIMPSTRLGTLNGCSITGDMRVVNGKLTACDITVNETSLTYNEHDFRSIVGNFVLADKKFEGQVEAVFDDGSISADFAGVADESEPSLSGEIKVRNINPYDLGIIKGYETYALNVDIDFDLTGVRKQWVNGYLNISDLVFASTEKSAPILDIKKFNVYANNTIYPNIIEINSDFLKGTVEGDIGLMTVVGNVRSVLARILPDVIHSAVTNPEGNLRNNDFSFNFTVENTENITEFFRLPIAVIHPVTIDGNVDYLSGIVNLGIDAPYLLKGDMIVEQTSLQVMLDGSANKGDVFVTTYFPTKKGPMSVVAGIAVSDGVISTEINWDIERDKPINGNLIFDTRLGRMIGTDKLTATVEFKPCSIHFGNDTWNIKPSVITYRPDYLGVEGFGLSTLTQSIGIDGYCAAADPLSDLTISLNNVVLNTIFETLDINKALIGGIATGTMHAGGIFDRMPFITTDNLHVENIGYNNCVLGDGDVKAMWNNEKQSFFLDAVVSQPGGHKSYIKGDIYPAAESLDITFRADHINVGFMRPFMDAFAEDVTGYASGYAHLFGTFKYIDMEGDVMAEDLGLKVGFTNTWYYATDSIHIVPGLIDISNVTVRDSEGHTATLNGFVRHTFFKDPVFDFRITGARDFLCYDVTPKLSPDWYGRIYGNGSAFITGHPGIVNIDVNMSTADNSTFTFVLSDTEEAEQYSFLTFRDKNRGLITDTIIQKEIIPPAVLAYRQKMLQQAQAQNPPSTYNMNIQMDVTPAAKVIIVMDPVGGDEIKSWGKGNLRMTYTSVGNDLRMYGTYAIDRGSYNFTLQDIIVKDFTIKEGSFISFTGDPYNATLDITASYLVNANLSDLDESFTADPELTRTNVPVHALLLVKGDMRQPDIAFDLEFPTLTSDVYRKVRSIISTDEMMNRQMIYLLALNRFYTPEYMTTTKGNELFSVASSTISSRLSSMLGKLSENWSISPNIRSDKGDFSDVQLDVALSSNLLNNRLRMNGNFGYRDKSLNTTQFIGDFDLEYLLDRRGSWRLKAYNRFNDQTYFLRTAKTTQGVGIMFSREFDNWFSFLRRRKKTANDAPADNGTSEPVDTLTTVGEERIGL